MRYFFVLTISAVFLAGCSSSSAPVSTAEKSNVSATEPANVNNSAGSVNENSAAKSAADNTAPLTMEEFMNANNRVTDESANRSDLSGSPLGKSPRGRKRSDAPVDPHVETVLTVAPDNSVITTSMNKDGAPTETRTFKSNPTLLKVERVYTDLKNPTIKVFLKNGKVLDLPQEKISDIFNVSANEILNAAGSAPPK